MEPNDPLVGNLKSTSLDLKEDGKMHVEGSRQARTYFQRHSKFEQPAEMAEDSILFQISNFQFQISDLPLPRPLLLSSRTRTIFSLHRCRGSSPVERGPEKAGVGSSTLPPGTIDAAISLRSAVSTNEIG